MMMLIKMVFNAVIMMIIVVSSRGSDAYSPCPQDWDSFPLGRRLLVHELYNNVNFNEVNILLRAFLNVR